MNIEELKAKLNQLLERLKEDLPRAERIAIIQELQEIIDQLLQ